MGELVVSVALRRDRSNMLDGPMREWLGENVRRGSGGLLRALINDGKHHDLLRDAKRYWAKARGDASASEEEEDLDEDVPERFVQPNRHVTMLIYLNEVSEGGETVFPRAQPLPGRKRIVRDGMPDCSKGIVVPPLAFGAALFYHKHGNGTNDRLSAHGGCPPVRGEKWAINSFMWNVPMSEGLRHYQN